MTTPHKPVVRAYIRVSHERSAKSNLSPETQEALIRSRWQREVERSSIMGKDFAGFPQWATDGYRGAKKLGEETGDGLYIDLAVSAFKIPFDTRPAGSKLIQRLKPGDVLLI